MKQINMRNFTYAAGCVIFNLILCLILPPVDAFAQEKPLGPIKVGISAALSGPAKLLGTNMKLGIETYFDTANQEGGINGRKLHLIAMDDGYDPEAAARNMNILIEQESVLAVIGNVGTPTAKVTIPIANEKKTLLFGAFTGAGLLRKNPPDRYVINYRASYAQETATMVKSLFQWGILPYEIAFFTQNDSYGDSGYNGAIQALKSMGFPYGHRLPHGRYERNTLNIEDGLFTILQSYIKPRAIIMIGAYAPCAKFIRLAKRVFPDTFFMNVSFVGSIALAKALGPDGEGVIVTQVVPHFQSDLPITQAYLRDLKRYAPQSSPCFVSLEGYIVARIFVEGARRAGKHLNRESIIDAILNIKDLDIVMQSRINDSKTSYQGSQTVWQTIITDGQFRPLDSFIPSAEKRTPPGIRDKIFMNRKSDLP